MNPGYGIMVGPHSTKETHKKFAQLIEKIPELYRSANAFYLLRQPMWMALFSRAI